GDAGCARRLDDLFVQLVARLGENLAGLEVDEVGGGETADEREVLDEELLDALLRDLVGAPGGDLLAGLRDDVAGLGVDQVVLGLGAAETLGGVGNLPTRVRAAL